MEKKIWRHGARARFNKNVFDEYRERAQDAEDILLALFFMIPLRLVLCASFHKNRFSHPKGKMGNGDGNTPFTDTNPPGGWRGDLTRRVSILGRTRRNCCYTWQPPSNIWKCCLSPLSKNRNFSFIIIVILVKKIYNFWGHNTPMYQDRKKESRLSLSSGQVWWNIHRDEINWIILKSKTSTSWPCNKKYGGVVPGTY